MDTEAARGRSDVVQQVATNLSALWRRPATHPLKASPPSGPPTELARWGSELLIAAASELLDSKVSPFSRRALAWLLAPGTCIGRSDDDLVLAEVAGILRRDAGRLQGVVDDHDGAAKLVPQILGTYTARQGPRDLWLYLAEAVRSAAEDLSAIADLAATPETASEVDPVAYVATVFGARCPGWEVLLVDAEVRAAVEAWPLTRRIKGQGRWATLDRLLRGHRPRIGTTTMSREWSTRRHRVAIPRSHIMVAIPKALGYSGRRVSFKPFPTVLIARAVLNAEHATKRFLRATSATVGKEHGDSVVRPVPDALWADVSERLSSCRSARGSGSGRGRPPLDERFILATVLHVLRSGARWKDVPHGSTVHARYLRWKDCGCLPDVLAAAREHGALPLELPRRAGARRGRNRPPRPPIDIDFSRFTKP